MTVIELLSISSLLSVLVLASTSSRDINSEYLSPYLCMVMFICIECMGMDYLYGMLMEVVDKLLFKSLKILLEVACTFDVALARIWCA